MNIKNNSILSKKKFEMIIIKKEILISHFIKNKLNFFN